MSKGLLIAVSGFSGSGKGTLMKKVLEMYPNYALSVSATTRRPRPGEREGVEYFFKTKEEFEELIDNDELIEYAKYVDNYYGTPKAYVEQMLDEGRDVILEIEVQGALQVKKKIPGLVLIFITAPSLAELKRRFAERGTETEENIRKRIEQIEREFESMMNYEYILENDDLDECAAAFHGIVQAEHKKLINQKEFIQKISEEFGGKI